jgi:uncharacterized protein
MAHQFSPAAAKRELLALPACRAELTLNRRLAPDVYKAVAPLMQKSGDLAVGGAGEIVDWLIVIRRLDESQTLEHALLTGRLAAWQLDRLVAMLVAFYRRATAVLVSADTHLANWHRNLAYNRAVLLDPRFTAAARLIRRVDQAQRRFLAQRSRLIADRVRHRHIVDGHATCARSISGSAIQ